MTTLLQGDLRKDPGILRTSAQHNKVMIAPLGQLMASVGVYAPLRREGTIRRVTLCTWSRDPITARTGRSNRIVGAVLALPEESLEPREHL